MSKLGHLTATHSDCNLIWLSQYHLIITTVLLITIIYINCLITSACQKHRFMSWLVSISIIRHHF